MKQIIYSLLALSLIGTISCNKKDDCVPATLSETIIGEWNVSVLGSDGDVEFKEDGTLIDPDDILIGGESGTGEPLDQKSYTVDGDAAITVRATNASGTFSVSFEFEVTDVKCDEIEFEILGFGGTMRRR